MPVTDIVFDSESRSAVAISITKSLCRCILYLSLFLIAASIPSHELEDHNPEGCLVVHSEAETVEHAAHAES
jgi:hypothetical protein